MIRSKEASSSSGRLTRKRESKSCSTVSSVGGAPLPALSDSVGESMGEPAGSGGVDSGMGTLSGGAEVERTAAEEGGERAAG